MDFIIDKIKTLLFKRWMLLSSWDSSWDLKTTFCYIIKVMSFYFLILKKIKHSQTLGLDLLIRNAHLKKKTIMYKLLVDKYE